MRKILIDQYGFESTSQWYHRRRLEAYKVKKMDDGTVFSCFHESARCPVHRLDIAPDGSTRLMWAFGKWNEMENLQYAPINQELIVEVDDQY